MRFIVCSLMAFVATLGCVNCSKVLEISAGLPPPQQTILYPQQQQQIYSQVQYYEQEKRQEQAPLGIKGEHARKQPLYKQPAPQPAPQTGALAFVIIRPIQPQYAEPQRPLRPIGGTKGGSVERRPLKPIRQSGAQIKVVSTGQERKTRPIAYRPLAIESDEGFNQQIQQIEQQHEQGLEQQQQIEQELEQPPQPIVQQQQPLPPIQQSGVYAEAYGTGKFLKLKSSFEKLKSKLTLGSSYVVAGEEIVNPVQPQPSPPLIQQQAMQVHEQIPDQEQLPEQEPEQQKPQQEPEQQEQLPEQTRDQDHDHFDVQQEDKRQQGKGEQQQHWEQSESTKWQDQDDAFRRQEQGRLTSHQLAAATKQQTRAEKKEQH